MGSKDGRSGAYKRVAAEELFYRKLREVRYNFPDRQKSLHIG